MGVRMAAFEQSVRIVRFATPPGAGRCSESAVERPLPRRKRHRPGGFRDGPVRLEPVVVAVEQVLAAGAYCYGTDRFCNDFEDLRGRSLEVGADHLRDRADLLLRNSRFCNAASRLGRSTPGYGRASTPCRTAESDPVLPFAGSVGSCRMAPPATLALEPGPTMD